LKINTIRFFRLKLRLAEKEFQREQEEIDRVRFFVKKDLEGNYSEEEIGKMWYDRNLRFIEDTGNSLN